MATGLSPFPTTQWTAVVEAMRTENIPRRQEAFAALCRAYWKPLYIFARGLGYDQYEAEDLTQGFFAYLAQRPALKPATPELGKLRTFLLKIFQRYVGDMRDRGNAQRRGGGVRIYSLEMDEGDDFPPFDIAGSETPETLFDRAWTNSLLTATLQALGAAEAAAGRGQIFEALKCQLNAEGAEPGLSAATGELGMNPEAIRQALCRLRKKFRECLRQRIAATLIDPSEARIDEELRALKAALRQ